VGKLNELLNPLGLSAEEQGVAEKLVGQVYPNEIPMNSGEWATLLKLLVTGAVFKFSGGKVTVEKVS
jgi:hypothetical protein